MYRVVDLKELKALYRYCNTGPSVTINTPLLYNKATCCKSLDETKKLTKNLRCGGLLETLQFLYFTMGYRRSRS